MDHACWGYPGYALDWLALHFLCSCLRTLRWNWWVMGVFLHEAFGGPARRSLKAATLLSIPAAMPETSHFSCPRPHWFSIFIAAILKRAQRSLTVLLICISLKAHDAEDICRALKEDVFRSFAHLYIFQLYCVLVLFWFGGGAVFFSFDFGFWRFGFLAF